MISKSGAGAVLLLIIVALATFGVAITAVMPDTPSDAARSAESYAEEHNSLSESYYFSCPSDGSLTQYVRLLSLDIDETVYESSMARDVIRYQSSLFSYDIFLTPDDPYVKQVADKLVSLTPDGSDYLRATAALWFVQTAIGYQYDSVLYGTGEFTAYPVETLYLHTGDCEDQAILLASIMLAMGLDCVLLDFPGHVAVGVAVGSGYGTYYTLDGKEYSFCEATASSAQKIGTLAPSETPEFVKPNSSNKLCVKLAEVVAGYRYIIQGIFKI